MVNVYLVRLSFFLCSQLIVDSLDQTSRLHAPCNEEWHELARPQIHGHDIHAMTIIDTTHGLKFATGAEETIVRLFEASSSFVDSVTKLTGCTLPLGERPMAAVVPPLGLSNRAVKGQRALFRLIDHADGCRQ